jgi:hypothetical protein
MTTYAKFCYAITTLKEKNSIEAVNRLYSLSSFKELSDHLNLTLVKLYAKRQRLLADKILLKSYAKQIKDCYKQLSDLLLEILKNNKYSAMMMFLNNRIEEIFKLKTKIKEV